MKLKLPSVDCQYGSPMGRRNILPDDTQTAVKLRLNPVRMVDLCYDQGGAYWGMGTQLWWAEGEDTRLFVRAVSREAAKALVRQSLPNARFFR